MIPIADPAKLNLPTGAYNEKKRVKKTKITERGSHGCLLLMKTAIIFQYPTEFKLKTALQ
jgi:hypothetical protein